MRKIGMVLFCISLCLAVAFIFPQVGNSWKMVDDDGCLVCHTVDYGSTDPDEQHVKHSSLNCSQCHDGGGQEGNVNASACIECHPFGGAGKCPLVNFHDPGKGATCLTCHSDCAATSTTTSAAASTTTTSAAGGTCPSEEIYGEDSEEVEILRCLRDNVLSATPEGQEIIRLYYQWAPVITVAIQNDEEVRAEIKALVDGILQMVVEE